MKKINFDTLWKNVINLFIEDFVSFFMADLYPKVDFTIKPDFLDKELDKVFGDGNPKGVRRSDQLVRLHLKDGTNCWILVHIEVQKELNSSFSKRMFRYFYRIYDKYEEESSGIEAVAVLLNKISKYEKYNTYLYKYGETEIRYKYRIYQIFNQSEEYLSNNKNPFSIVVLASRYAIKYKDDLEKRKAFKYKLAKLAFERGYNKTVITQLLAFIYYLIELPDKDNNEFKTKIRENMETADSMTFDEGLYYFITQIFGKEAVEASYVTVEEYNIARQEREQARKEEEQARKKEEQAIKEAKIKLLTTIANLQKYGFSLDKISEITGSNIDEINEILKSEEINN